jgi:hypothetical protein
MADLKDHSLESAPEDLVKQEMTFPISVYSYKGVRANLNITFLSESSADLVDWCFK